MHLCCAGWFLDEVAYIHQLVLAILGLISSMTFSLINGIIESINSWFLRVAQTTSDRCRMVSLWTAVERAWSVLTVLEVTDSLIKGEPKAESLACLSRCCVEGDELSGLLSGWSLLLLALGVWDTKLSSLDCLSLFTLSAILSFIRLDKNMYMFVKKSLHIHRWNNLQIHNWIKFV